MMAAALLIATTLLLIYIYAGYPVLLGLLARLFPRPHRKEEGLEPSVTLIISAHNEEKVIRAKLENAFAIDYPRDRLTLMVVSDGSTDSTDDIVRSFGDRGVVLVRPLERRGKTAGLNEAMDLVETDLVVFSDANAMYDPAALRKMVRHFADERIGYVVGHARYESTGTAAGSSEGTYWDFEVRLKQWESAFDSVVGGDGAIYAIRRELYEKLEETDINDFVNPLQIVAKGYRGVFDPEAFCLERPAGEFQKEFGRKVRIANRSFNGLLRVPSVCNPLHVGRFAWQVISHKLLRWLSPYIVSIHFLAVLFATVFSGHRSAAGVMSLLFSIFYLCLALLALIGCRKSGRGEKVHPLFYLPYYLVLMNVASATGIWLRLKGVVISTWETVRETGARKRRESRLVPLLLLFILVLAALSLLLRFDFGPVLVQGSAYLLAGLSVHAYLGYPFSLALLARMKSVRVDKSEDCLPEITLLITAYNEERVIRKKLENSLELDYPRHRFRIVVASDGSTDRTNDIADEFADRGVILLALAPNRGKIAALNEAMEGIRSEIVVFSDANVLYDRLALRKLARNFHDPRVGVVSGRVLLVNEAVSYGKAEDCYYSLEHFIQEMEGRTGALIGADGAMYAIRRPLFHPPAPDTILDDFAIPMAVARAGYLVVHEKEALGYEENLQEIKGEFRRKTRIIAGGFQYLLEHGFPERGQGLFLFKFISHKFLRWVSGPLVLLLFVMLLIARLGPATPVLSLALDLLSGALAAALLSHLAPSLRKVRPFSFIYYFFMLKLASLVGLWLGLTGRQGVTWRREAA